MSDDRCDCHECTGLRAYGAQVWQMRRRRLPYGECLPVSGTLSLPFRFRGWHRSGDGSWTWWPA